MRQCISEAVPGAQPERLPAYSGRVRRSERGSITPGTSRAGYIEWNPRSVWKSGGSRRLVGPLGGPACSRRRVIAAFSTGPPGPTPFAPSPSPLVTTHLSHPRPDCWSLSGSGAAGAMRSEPHRSFRVKPTRVALTCSDARRRWSHARVNNTTFLHRCRAVARVVLTTARTAGERVKVASRLPARSRAFCFGRALRIEAFELVGLMIDVTHRGRDRAMSGLHLDETMHLLRDATVRRVTLR